MSNVINMWEWKRRARLGGEPPSITPRTPRRRRREDRDFVRIGTVSMKLLERLR